MCGGLLSPPLEELLRLCGELVSCLLRLARAWRSFKIPRSSRWLCCACFAFRLLGVCLGVLESHALETFAFEGRGLSYGSTGALSCSKTSFGTGAFFPHRQAVRHVLGARRGRGAQGVRVGSLLKSFEHHLTRTGRSFNGTIFAYGQTGAGKTRLLRVFFFL